MLEERPFKDACVFPCNENDKKKGVTKKAGAVKKRAPQNKKILLISNLITHVINTLFNASIFIEHGIYHLGPHLLGYLQLPADSIHSACDKILQTFSS